MASISGIVKSARKIMHQDTSTGRDELRILQLGCPTKIIGKIHGEQSARKLLV